ncbi:MAG: hypothetical protein GY865_11855 [candidate division Zixibacteria bacterium]|nr:hypothetical protein [candidate division Zixibacteria bacterium]
MDSKSKYDEKIIGEFDNEKRIFHLSATEVLNIDTKQQLEELCSIVSNKLGKHVESDRCYMIVDLSKFIIDLKLSDCYAEKIQHIIENGLYNNGLARYGYEVTRMTIQKGHQTKVKGDPNLFGTKKDAFDYIDSLIQMKSISNRTA